MSREQAARLYSELSRKTQEGEIEWERFEDGKITGFSGDSIIDAFITTHNGRRLGLLRMGVKAYDGERDVEYWEEEMRLVFLNEFEHVRFEFPSAHGISDLFQSVTYVTSDVADFVADVLGEKKPASKGKNKPK